jgi:hypothetical protein
MALRSQVGWDWDSMKLDHLYQNWHIHHPSPRLQFYRLLDHFDTPWSWRIQKIGCRLWQRSMPIISLAVATASRCKEISWRADRSLLRLRFVTAKWMVIHGEYGRIIKTWGSNNRKWVMRFDGEIVKRAPWLMSYLNDFKWRIDDHLFIISGIDQQTYGTSRRNYGWLMSSSGGPLLSATFEII